MTTPRFSWALAASLGHRFNSPLYARERFICLPRKATATVVPQASKELEFYNYQNEAWYL